jgi:O-antigen/teichoic acid export membrane protein
MLTNGTERRSVMRILRSNLFAGLTDQAMVSLANFALSVTLARALPTSDYGIYAVAMSFLVFLNTLHQAFVIYPLTIRAGLARQQEYAHLLRTALLLTALGALALLPILGAGLLSMSRLSLLPWVFATLIAWQIQEVFRRGYLARHNGLAALLIDFVRYLGPIAAVLALANRLSIPIVFICIALASFVAIAPLLPALLRNAKFSWAIIRPIVLHNWRQTGPLLGANLLYAFTAQWFLWLLTWSRGPTQPATLMALTNVVAIISPIILGTETILVPEVAAIQDTESFPASFRHFIRRSAIFGMIALPPLAAVAIFPKQALGLFYSHHADYVQYPDVLRLLAAIYATYFVATVLSAFLRGCKKVQFAFKMQFYPALIGITAGTYLTLKFGLDGACVGMLIAGLARAALGGLFIAQARHQSDANPQAMVLS